MTITAETITPRQVEILLYLSAKRWRTCEKWSKFPPKEVEPLVQAGLVDYAKGMFPSSRRRITPAGREFLAHLELRGVAAAAQSLAVVRTASEALLPLYEPPPDRLAKPGELRGRLGFEFKKTVSCARVRAGSNGLRLVHAAMLGAPFCDFTDEPIERWESVGHGWIKVDVSSVEEAAAAQVGTGLRSEVTCSGCLSVLSTNARILDRMLEIMRTHA